MSLNDSHLNLLPIYKLFFDDIEEIFLNQISFRFLLTLVLLTFVLMLILIVFLCCLNVDLFSTTVVPFIFALILYDFIQLFSVVLLKFYLSEHFVSGLCRWPYYLKSLSEAGQCLTLIFLLATIRRHLHYYHTHHRFPNNHKIYARVLNFVCVLFIIYIHNWITHLKAEKLHSISMNENNSEMQIEELSHSFFARAEMINGSYRSFINDLEKYSQGYENSFRREQSTKPEWFNSKPRDASNHQIFIPFQFDGIRDVTLNRTRRHLISTTINNQSNNSYGILRCTYSQENFLLVHSLMFLHSFIYLIVILYYLIAIATSQISLRTVRYDENIFQQNSDNERRKSTIENQQKQSTILIRLKRFLIIIVFSQTLFACLHLTYTCALTMSVTLFDTPIRSVTIKHVFYTTFIIHYYSIPLRLFILIIYLLLSQYSSHFQSIFSYIVYTKLHFNLKFQRPEVCFRCQLIPFEKNFHLKPNNNDLSSSTIDIDQSAVLVHETTVVHEESSVTISHKTTHPSVTHV